MDSVAEFLDQAASFPINSAARKRLEKRRALGAPFPDMHITSAMDTKFQPHMSRIVAPLLIGITALLHCYQARASEVRIVCHNDAGDAARINTAIEGSKAGDEIVFSGTALLNQTIKLRGERSYRGESRAGTVLRQADGANLVALLASDRFLDNSPTTGLPVSIAHLKLVGNHANNKIPTCGIILRSWLSVVDDVEVRSMGGDGLRVTSLSANGTKLTNHQVNGRISNCFITDSGHHGIFVEDPGNSCTDWMLSDNWIAQSGVDGIHLDNAAGWYIERNHVYGVSQNAIFANRAYATSITSNYIEGFGENQTPGRYYGIGLTLQGNIGSTVSDNRIFSISGGKNAKSTYSSIGVVQVNYQDGYVNIHGNTLRGTGASNFIGVNYAKGKAENTSLNITSFGNSISNMGTPCLMEKGVVLSPGI
ncbi:hypothetical protein IAD21_01240 [Abditibacteriota bacterium]|nr:hypothetical protein IAD21_01240 [Abditibacteriota bacterium]